MMGETPIDEMAATELCIESSPMCPCSQSTITPYSRQRTQLISLNVAYVKTGHGDNLSMSYRRNCNKGHQGQLMLAKGVQKSETRVLHWRCECGIVLSLYSHGGLFDNVASAGCRRPSRDKVKCVREHHSSSGGDAILLYFSQISSDLLDMMRAIILFVDCRPKESQEDKEGEKPRRSSSPRFVAPPAPQQLGRPREFPLGGAAPPSSSICATAVRSRVLSLENLT